MEAAWEADFIRSYGLEKSRRTDQGKFDEAMSDLKVIALEDNRTCRAVSKKELMDFTEVWTVDSRLVRNIEGISGTLGIDLPTEKIVEKLGKSIEPAIPLPRVLGTSKNPIQDRVITKIRIFPEERTHRIDICWEKSKSDKWIAVPKRIMDRTTSFDYSTREVSVFLTRDKEVSSECSNYDLVVWRQWYLILPNSGVPELLDALGMNERFGRWLVVLLTHGIIPPDQRPVLKEHLTDAKYKDVDMLLDCLGLPFERRFGDSRGTARDSQIF